MTGTYLRTSILLQFYFGSVRFYLPFLSSLQRKGQSPFLDISSMLFYYHYNLFKKGNVLVQYMSMAFVELDKLLNEQMGSTRIIVVSKHVRSCFLRCVFGNLKRDLAQRQSHIILTIFSYVIIVSVETLLRQTPIKFNGSARNIWVPLR